MRVVEHYERAERHHALGAYPQAIAELSRAYQLSGKPALLFNIAQSYRLQGDCAQAVRFYKNYLRLESDPPNREDVEARIVEQEACVAERKRAEEAARGTQRETGTAETGTEPAPVPAVVAPPADRPAGGGTALKVSGLTTAAVGLVLVGVGVYFGLEASSTADELERHLDQTRFWDQTARDLEADGEAAQTTATVLYAVGAAAVVTGGVLYYLGWRDARRSRSGVAIVPGPDGARATWTWAF